MLDIRDLYFSCLRGRLASNKFTGSTIKNHTISPFITYCNTFVSEDFKDLETPLIQMLAHQGQIHEKNVVQSNFPDWIRCPVIDGKEAFLIALKYMTKRFPIITQVPLYYVPSQFMGYLDVIRLNPTENSIFGNYFYEVIEIKLAKNLKLEHILQAAYYTYLIGKIQEFIPTKFYLINKEGVETEFLYSDYENQLKATLIEIRQIWDKQIIPHAYYSDTSKSYPWDNYRNQLAIENKDISLVPGIGESLCEKLNQAEIKTVEQLGNSSIETIQGIKGIKSKATVFITRAQAITNQTIIPLSASISLPQETNTVIFIDFEAIDSFFLPEELNGFVYLFGTLIISNRMEHFFPHHVVNPEDLNEQRNVVKEFIQKIKEYPQALIFHWGHYEKTHLKKICNKFELNSDFTEISKRFFDLRVIIEKNFAFPTFSYSLKSIAKYLGFLWSEENMDGLNATLQYLKLYRNPKASSIIESLIQYNFDDLKATWKIKDWIYSNHKRLMK